MLARTVCSPLLLLMWSGWCVASPLTVYDQSNLGGSGTVIPQTFTVYSGAGIPGGMNNSISSFQLDQGYMAIVADMSNGLGPSRTYVAAESPLTVNTLPAGLNNTISFIRVVPWKYTLKKGTAGDVSADVSQDWYYKWGYFVADGQAIDTREYVPMAWGAGATDQAAIDAMLSMDQVTHLLGFNESDNCSGQSGQYNNLCDVPTAVGYYENLMKAGLRLGSPATREEAAGGANDWLTQFVDQCEAADIRVDFIALHWYDWGSSPAANPSPDPQDVFDRFKTYLSDAYHRYRRPLWITEWNANVNRETAIQDSFLQLALPYLESLGYVERYAWFQPFSGTGDFSSGGELTSTGQIYNDQVSTPAYTSGVLPAGWTSLDVGAASQEGVALHANNTFTVCGSGAGTGGTADEFQFLHEPVLGDAQIIARVNSIMERNNASQAGIMIRESLAAGSRHASMFVTGGNGAQFEYRTVTDGSSGSSTAAGVEAPYWVKMVRRGDALSGYTSADGTNWTLRGSQTVVMTAGVYVGLAVASRSGSQFSDAVFTDVAVSDGFIPNSPPSFTADPISKPNATEGAAYSDTLAGSATDPDSDPLGYSVIGGGPAWLSVATNGILSGTPGALDLGPNSWTVQVTDGNGGTNIATMNITVNSASSDPVTLVGGPTRNGDFNANPGTSVDFAGTAAWYNLGGAQTAEATRSNLTYDATQNAVLASDRHFAVDTGHTIAEGDVFDIRYVWRDAWDWVDASDQISVSLFVTADDNLTGARTDLVTDLSPTSTTDSTYEAVDRYSIYTAQAGDAGKTLFVAIETSSAGFARMDDFQLIATSVAALSGYAAWAETYGMTGILAIATNDYDGDGAINLWEYGSDGNPTNAASQGTAPIGRITQSGGTNGFEYIHLQRTNFNHGLTYTLEQTLDLIGQPWSNSVDAVVVGIGSASSSDFMTVTNKIPTSGKAKEFLRLRIDN